MTKANDSEDKPRFRLTQMSGYKAEEDLREYEFVSALDNGWMLFERSDIVTVREVARALAKEMAAVAANTVIFTIDPEGQERIATL